MPLTMKLDDETFVKLIASDFENIRKRTGGRISLQSDTATLVGPDRKWRVLHGENGTSTMLDDTEVAAFTLGVISALNVRDDHA